MEWVVSRSGKKLSTFEFERQHIAGRCKQTFRFQFNIKMIQSKTWFFQFSQNGRHNKNFFTLPDLDSIKNLVPFTSYLNGLTIHIKNINRINQLTNVSSTDLQEAPFSHGSKASLQKSRFSLQSTPSYRPPWQSHL